MMGKLRVVCDEMDRNNISVLGVAETRWRERGRFVTDSGKMVVFSGK